MTETRIPQALDYLRENGWTQEGTGTGPGGERCMMVALSRSWGFLKNHQATLDYHRDVEAIEAIVDDQYPDRLDPDWDDFRGVGFNDHPETTFADIERVMEKSTILRLEEI